MAGFGSLIPDSGAAFGTQSPGEEGARTPSGLDAIIANIINGTLAIPKRAIDASTSDVQQLQDTGQFGRSAVAPATDTAMTMMGASAPFALARPGATAGIFGGRLAQTADHTKLARAEEMAAGGADRSANGGTEMSIGEKRPGFGWDDYAARRAEREAKDAAYDAMTPEARAAHDAAESARLEKMDSDRIAARDAGMAAAMAKRKVQIAKDVAAGKIPEGSTHTHREMREMAASEREDARMNAADAAGAAADTTPTVAAPDFMNMKSMQPRKRPGWDD